MIKNKTVSFHTSKGQNTYNHATLDSICDTISGALSDVGITYRWETTQTESMISVSCVLTHALGYSEKVTLQGPPDLSGSKNSIQAIGSTVSYLQRYTLLSATGLATEDQDTDGIVPTQQDNNVTQKISGAKSIEDLAALMNELSSEEKRLYMSNFKKRKQELMK